MDTKDTGGWNVADERAGIGCKAKLTERATSAPATEVNAHYITVPAYPIPLSQWRSSIAAACHPLTINFVTFFLLSLIIFRRNNDFLFFGDDGKFEVTLIEQFPKFVPPLIGFTSDMLRGLGNVYFSVNPYWIPAYFLPLSWQGEYSNFALTYSLCASEVFVATYLTTRLLRLPIIVGLIAAWVVPLVIMPYFGFGLIPHTAAAFPHYATALAVSTVLASICSIVGDRTPAVNVTLSVILTLGISFVAIVAPPLLILAVPLALVSAVLSCITSATRRELALKLAIFGLVGTICLAAFGPFVAGLLFNSTASFFKELSIGPPTLNGISMLFWTPYPILSITRLFVAGGLLGAAVVAWTANGVARNAAVSLLITEAGFLAIGGLQFIRAFWYGPALWYFEGFLFCYLAIFLTAGFFVIGRVAVVGIGRLLNPNRTRIFGFTPGLLTGVAIAGLMVVLVLHRGTTGTAGPFFLSYPQAETPITSILKREISLKFDRRFRGRVADFMGRSLPDSNDFQIWHYLRYFALYESGNTHGVAGLWQDAIPTLTEYNQLMTPTHFVFMRRFFTRPNDGQTRNRIEMRHIDPRLLATIGVRFVITDVPYEGQLQLRSEIPISVPESRREAFGAPQMFRDHSFSLYLYELLRTNVGQYSPTILLRADNAAGILKALASPDLDPARTVVTSEALPEDLVPAQLQEFNIGRGNVHVRAASPGRSLLLLPIEFSHCLTVANTTASMNGRSSAHLLRADLVLTGLLFEQAVDVNIAYFTGPFSNSICRLQDRTESMRLDVANAFRNQPGFFP